MIFMTETKLPDFDDMLGIANQMKELTLQKILLENEIAEKESAAIKYHTENTLVNGKPPSMEYAKVVYKPVGLNDELIPLRKQLAEVEADLTSKKTVFDVYKSMISVWQTESANKRAVTL